MPSTFHEFSKVVPFNFAEKITDEKNTSEDWGMIMDLCDRVQATSNGPRDCLKSVTKRLQHQDPHVVMQAITVLTYTSLQYSFFVRNSRKILKMFEAEIKQSL